MGKSWLACALGHKACREGYSYERRSTLVTSQLPVGHWHEVIGDPTLWS